MHNAITTIHRGNIEGTTHVVGWPSCLDDGDPGSWIMQTLDDWYACLESVCAPSQEWDSGLPRGAGVQDLAAWVADVLRCGVVRLEYGRHLVKPRGLHLPRLEPVYFVIPEH